MRELCQETVTPDDGLVFDVDSVVGEEITVESEYVGVRVRFLAHLGSARIRMQIDVGFGDAVVGADPEVELPTILEFPAPRLLGYSRETAIAEKLCAMFQHGRLNSRMKDYFDIGLLARHFPFEGKKLAQAIAATFARRETRLDADPIGLRDEFAEQPGKQAQWAAFLKKIGSHDAPVGLLNRLAELRQFLLPVLEALVAGIAFEGRWPRGGPWEMPG